MHEAGHAVAAIALGSPFVKVTIVSTAGYEGALVSDDSKPDDEPQRAPEPWRSPMGPESRYFLENVTMKMLAGPVAQAGHERRFSMPHYRADVGLAEELAAAAGQRDCWEAWVYWLWCRTVNLLTRDSNWDAIELTARALLSAGSLTYAEVQEQCERAKVMLDMNLMERASRARRFLTTRRPLLAMASEPPQFAGNAIE
jgi:hypothetical protein